MISMAMQSTSTSANVPSSDGTRKSSKKHRGDSSNDDSDSELIAVGFELSKTCLIVTACLVGSQARPLSRHPAILGSNHG